MMINGIIKFVDIGTVKTGNPDVSSQSTEFEKLISELFLVLSQNLKSNLINADDLLINQISATSPEIQQSNKDTTLRESTILLLPFFPLLDKLSNQQSELEISKSINLANLRDGTIQIDNDIFKLITNSTESVNNSEIVKFFKSIHLSENIDFEKNIDTLRHYLENVTSKFNSHSTKLKTVQTLIENQEEFKILNLNQESSIKKEENQILLNSLFENSNDEQLAKKAPKETIKIENIVINDKSLGSNELTINKSFEKNFDIPVFKLTEVPEAILKTLSTQNRTLVVQLEPPELGKILIKLTLDTAGVKADLKVDYPHVKEMITGLIPEIKSNLQSSGIKLSDFVLDLMRDHREYRDSYQGQKRNRGNQKFIEYFA